MSKKMSKKVKKPWSRKKKVIVGVIVAVIALSLLGTDWDEVQRQAEQAAQLEEEQKAKEEKQKEKKEEKEKKEKQEDKKPAKMSAELRDNAVMLIRTYTILENTYKNRFGMSADTIISTMKANSEEASYITIDVEKLDDQPYKNQVIKLGEGISAMSYYIMCDAEKGYITDFDKEMKELEQLRKKLGRKLV